MSRTAELGVQAPSLGERAVRSIELVELEEAFMMIHGRTNKLILRARDLHHAGAELSSYRDPVEDVIAALERANRELRAAG